MHNDSAHIIFPLINLVDRSPKKKNGYQKTLEVKTALDYLFLFTFTLFYDILSFKFERQLPKATKNFQQYFMLYTYTTKVLDTDYAGSQKI